MNSWPIEFSCFLMILNLLCANYFWNSKSGSVWTYIGMFGNVLGASLGLAELLRYVVAG